MEITARARFVKTAPDKIRILAGILKERKIDAALAQLGATNKAGARSLILVLKQAKGQIKDKNKVVEDFLVKSLQVDEGPKLKRRRICSKGRSTMILKRMAHVKIILTDDLNDKLKMTPLGTHIKKDKNIKPDLKKNIKATPKNKKASV